MTTAPDGGWAACVTLVAAHVVSWQTAGTVAAVVSGILVFRLLAERARRKTLEVTYREAPGDTIVDLGEGPGGPPMWIRIGKGQRPGPPATVIWGPVRRPRRLWWRRG